jgi:uncharacterized protein (TIGR02246 family)
MVLISLFAATVLAAPPPAAAATTSAKAPAIVAVADAYVAAVLKGDAAAVGRQYTEDAVEMPPGMPSIKGKPAIQEYYTKLFGGPGKVTAFTLDHIESRTSGDVGYDAGTYRQTMSPAPPGAPPEDTGKYVVVLKRTGGQWKVAYAIYNSDLAPPSAPATPPAH